MTKRQLAHLFMLYSLDSFDDFLAPMIKDCILEIKKNVETIGFKVIDWRLERDSLTLTLFLFGDSKKKKNVEKVVDTTFNNKLGDQVRLRRLISSFLDIPTQLPIRTIELSFFSKLVLKYAKFLAFLAKQHIDINDFLLEPLTQPHEISLFIKRRERTLRNNSSRIKTFVQKWQKELETLNALAISMLYLIYNMQDFLPLDVLVEKLSHIFSISVSEIYSNLSKLVTKRFLLCEENSIKLTDLGKDFVADLLDLINLIEKKAIRRLPGLLEKVMKQPTSADKYIVYRSGHISRFSIGKIFESLILAGLEYEVASKVLDGVCEYISYEDIIAERELVTIIKSLINLVDPTGESTIKYNYFINTREYIHIRYRGYEIPLSHEFLSKIIMEHLGAIRDKRLSPALLNHIASKTLKAIRILFVSATRDVTREKPILVREELLNCIIENLLEETIPFYKMVKESSIDDASLIREKIKTAKEKFERILVSEDKKSRTILYDFITGAKLLMWSILFALNYWPHPSVISSATILMHVVRDERKKSKDVKMFKRFEEFARRASQTIVQSNLILLDSLTSAQIKSIIELAKFGSRLCDQFLEKIDSTLG